MKTELKCCVVRVLLAQQEALIRQLQDQHYVQYMQQCYNQQLLQQQLQQQQISESAVDPHGRSPTHAECQHPPPSSPAAYSHAGTGTRPETHGSESPNQNSLPNGLQKSDAADATVSSELADEDDTDAS